MESRQAAALRIYGCTQAEAIRLNDGQALSAPGSKADGYYTHRCNGIRRGVAWEFTLASWIDAWVSSGKWSQRGSGPGQFVMARHGDEGPYSPGNVSICTASNNVRQAWANGRNTPPPSGLGKGRGWTFDPQYRNPYRVRVIHKEIGRYLTQEEAEAAYQAAVAVALAECPCDSGPSDHLNASRHQMAGMKG